MSETLRDLAEIALSPIGNHTQDPHEAFDVANEHMLMVALFIRPEARLEELEWYQEFLERIEGILSGKEMRHGQGVSEQNHVSHPHPDLLGRVRATIEDTERLMAPKDIHV